MGSYRLTSVADRRLVDIYRYSLLNFGRSQSKDYLLGLEEAFERIASHPDIGRALDGTADIRRYVHRRHSIFYRSVRGGVLILDLLGAGQDPERHLL